MRRSHSFTIVDQGTEGTCELHMFARLFVRNIVRPDICNLRYEGKVIPPEVGDMTIECHEYLETQGGLPPITFLVPENCGGIRQYISTLMYLYVYYSILNHSPDATCKGTFTHENIKVLTHCIHTFYIPPQLSAKKEDIRMMLSTNQRFYVTVFDINLSSKLSSEPLMFNGFDKRCRLFLKRCTEQHMYVGATIRLKREDGHSFVISAIDRDGIDVKNSWGVDLDYIPFADLQGPHYVMKQTTSLSYEERYNMGIDEDEPEIKHNIITAPLRKLYYVGRHPWTDLDLRVSPSPTRTPRRPPARRIGSLRKSIRHSGRLKSRHLKSKRRKNETLYL